MKAISPMFISGTDLEANLTIALVAFVIATVMLIAFIVLIFTNKRFRTAFFRDDDRQEEKPKKAPAQKPKKAEAPEDKPRRAPRKKSEPGLFDDIPTVPLGGFTSQPQESEEERRQASDTFLTMSVRGGGRQPAKREKSASETLDKIPTVVLPKSDGTEDKPRGKTEAATKATKPKK